MRVYGTAGRKKVRAVDRPSKITRRQPVFTRGPEGIKVPQTAGGPGQKPQDFVGTQPEWITHWYYTRKLGPTAFDFQTSFAGGRQELGGLVADFIVPGYVGPRGLVVNIHGEYWHRYTSEQRAADVTTKDKYRQYGLEVIYVLEDTLVGGGYRYVLDMALQGVQLFGD